MKTKTPHINRTRALLTTAATAAVAIASLTTLTIPTAYAAHPTGGTQEISTVRLVVAQRVVRAARHSTYDWPVKPFARQHPVRGYLGDPRIKAPSESFHFGIDVSAPDGTLVYAIESGTVYAQNPEAISIVAVGGGHTFGYWHIIPSVKPGQFVRRHEVIGKIAAGWEHVHLAERVGSTYVNPLRDGGIGPYVDPTAPTVDTVSLQGTTLVVSVHDTPYPRVPGAWGGKFVTPALVRWRLVGGTDVPEWKTAADFRTVLPDKSLFRVVYGPDTRQNHKFCRGLYSIVLTRSWSEPAATGGPWTLQVEVRDTAGNRGVASLPFQPVQV